MENSNTKVKRVRRTNKQIDNDIMNAISSLVKEFGFSNITLTNITERANIQPNVFYKRFENLESAIIYFIKQYDYWLNDVFQAKTKDVSVPPNLNAIFDDLVNEFYDNTIMQRLIIWECSEDTPHTRSIAQLRDTNLEYLCLDFLNQLKGDQEMIRATAALVIGGIYYLIIHRNAATFCNIDYSTLEGKEVLRKSVTFALSKLFEFNNAEHDPKILDVARKLKAEGVDFETIEKCTGIDKNLLM